MMDIKCALLGILTRSKAFWNEAHRLAFIHDEGMVFWSALCFG